ncbi:MAG: hypothetical protein RLZ98_2733 [Pseudomonadota bacterium]|jgi:uncharacterized membrane protein
MAGIGFRLRSLGDQENLLMPVASIGHSVIIAAGPWLFTITAIALISAFAAGLAPAHVTEGFRIVVIYAFAISLVVATPIVLVTMRLVGDVLYARDVDRIAPLLAASLLVSTGLSVAAGLLCYGVVFRMSGATVVAATSCSAIVSQIWVTLAFCGAVRDYRGITISFLAGLAVSVAATLAVAGGQDWNAMIWMFNSGLLIVLAFLCGRVLLTFPSSKSGLSAFADLVIGIRLHAPLAVAGLAGALGVWIDKVVMWHSPERIMHETGLVHAPLYDSAMFTAYLTIVPALAMFVTHVETSFFRRYQNYFAAVRNHATLKQLDDIASSLKRDTFEQIGRLIMIQSALCTLVVIAAPTIVATAGLHYEQIGILRLGALGVLFQLIFFAATSLILFFDRQRSFMALQALFLLLQGVFAIASIYLGPAYYGLGYLLANLVCGVVALAVLERTLEDLTYITFVLSNRAKSVAQLYRGRLEGLFGKQNRIAELE